VRLKDGWIQETTTTELFKTPNSCISRKRYRLKEFLKNNRSKTFSGYCQKTLPNKSRIRHSVVIETPIRPLQINGFIYKTDTHSRFCHRAHRINIIDLYQVHGLHSFLQKRRL
jgi:hypothetical protein